MFLLTVPRRHFFCGSLLKPHFEKKGGGGLYWIWVVCHSVRLSALTNGPLLGTLTFRNSSRKPLYPNSFLSPPNSFFNIIVFKNHLRNKPHLHIKGANKLKMRFCPLSWLLFLEPNKNPNVRASVLPSVHHNFASAQHLENKSTDYHQILYMHTY